MWAAPGGVNRVLRCVREALVVSPYRGAAAAAAAAAAASAAAPTATTATAATSSTSPLLQLQHSQSHYNSHHTPPRPGGGSSASPPGVASHSTSAFGAAPSTAPAPIFNSMQSCVILALAEAVLSQSGTSDVVSLIHNFLFSPRDAMDRLTRDVVLPLLVSGVAPGTPVPDAHGDSLRMATEAFTRCVATAVARATITMVAHGPAPDWIELAIACALPRIAVERRKVVATTGQLQQSGQPTASP